MKELTILNFLPDEIIKLIHYHLQALIIQTTFTLNRPLTELKYGDRIITNFKNSSKKVYGTIIKVYEHKCKIKLLPRLIPKWKKCNINFWKSLINRYNFPYYTPKYITLRKKNIIKLNAWNENFENINNLDSSKRFNILSNVSNISNISNVSNVSNVSNISNVSNMFNYIF